MTTLNNQKGRSMFGLNDIDSDNVNSNNIVCDTFQAYISAVVPTVPSVSNNTSVANTKWVNDAILANVTVDTLQLSYENSTQTVLTLNDIVGAFKIKGNTNDPVIEILDDLDASVIVLNKSGDIDMTGDLTLSSGNQLISTGDLTLTSGDLTLSSGNQTISTGDLTLTSGDLTLTSGDLTLTSGDLTLSSGSQVISTGDLTLSSGSQVISTGDLTLTSGSVIMNSIAIGNSSTGTTGTNGVCIGAYAGDGTANNITAVGYQAGRTSQSNDSVCIGVLSGTTSANAYSISIGRETGRNNHAYGAISCGAFSSLNYSGNYSVNLGFQSGLSSSGDYNINIGYKAGYGDVSVSNCVVLNASGGIFNPSVANGFYVKPIRNVVPTNHAMLMLDTDTNEITYSDNANPTFATVTTNTINGNTTLGATLYGTSNASVTLGNQDLFGSGGSTTQILGDQTQVSAKSTLSLLSANILNIDATNTLNITASNLLIGNDTNVLMSNLCAGAYMCNSNNASDFIAPIFRSIIDYTKFYTDGDPVGPITVGTVVDMDYANNDDKYIILPGYRLKVFNSTTSHLFANIILDYDNNTQSPQSIKPTSINTGVSCSLYFNNVYIYA